MQRLTDFSKGLAGLTLTLGILVGLPIGLLAFVGSPLPTAWPGIGTVGQHLSDGDIPDEFILKLLATIAWIAWAQITTATLVEYVSILRGKASRRSLALPAVRMFTAKLATWTTLLVSAVGPVRPALAAPLAPIPTVAIPDTFAPAQPVEAQHASSESKETASYVAQRDDTWWSIAEDLLADGMRWREIRSQNVGARMHDGSTITMSTDAVRAGWTLAVPADAQLPGAPSIGTAPAAKEITVEEGDHFWAIAGQALSESWGRPPTDAELVPYWVEVVNANEGRLLPPGDPNLIYPDQTFVLPTLPPNPDQAPDLNGSDVAEPAIDVVPTAPADPPTSVPTDSPAVSDDAPVDPRVVVEENPVAEHAPAAVAPVPTTSANGGAGGDQNLFDQVAGSAKSIAAVAGGIGLLGGMLLFTLRRLRHIQAARRRPGTTIDPPEPEASAKERQFRSISVDGEDVRYIAAANSYLSHKLETSDTPIPHLIAMRAGQYGLELLLDEPCEPVAGFHTATDDRKGWTLSPHLDARMMESATKGDAHPFAPALSVVGETNAGNLLVDFEQMGSVSIEGDDEAVIGFQRGIVAGLCASPWGIECEIVAIGIDGLSNDELSRVTVPENPVEWAETTANKMRQIATSLDRSPYEERVAHGAVYHPTVVVIGPAADLAGIAQHLGPVADLAYSPFAVVSAHPLASEHRIAIEANAATIEPLGISIIPISLPAAELHAVDHLIANASDTSTSPPAQAWADEIRTADEGPGPEVNDVTEDVNNGSSDRNDIDLSADETVDSVVSDEAVARIAEIMEPRPVEIRILGRKPVVEGLEGSPSPKLEAIIVYLTFHRDVVSERLRDEFWTKSTGRSAADNAINRVRGFLGEDAEGKPRLDSARNRGSYSVSAEIGMDWHRVGALVEASRGARKADELAFLRAACDLIDGHIAVDASPSSYAWLLREPTIYTLIETTLVDAAHRCGELALEAGDCDLARWAARKGLTIVEGQESLYRMRMQAAFEAGDRDGIVQAFQEAQRAAESYGYAEEVQPETQELFEQLTSSTARMDN